MYFSQNYNSEGTLYDWYLSEAFVKTFTLKGYLVHDYKYSEIGFNVTSKNQLQIFCYT